MDWSVPENAEPRPTTEEEVWRWLESQLGEAPDDETKKYLAEKYYVTDMLEYGDELSRETLVKHARAQMRSRRAAARRRTGKAPLIRRLIPDHEVSRARALSELLGSVAARNPALIRLRQRLFGTPRPLKKAEAQQLLASVAPRYICFTEFEARGIPLVGHRSEFLNPETGRSAIDPSEATVLRITWGTETLDFPEATSLDAAARREGLDFHVGSAIEKVIQGSVFDEIRAVASRLAEHCIWSEAEATVFVLTGKVPQVPPIKVRLLGGMREHFEHSPLEIRVEPWLSPKTVLAVYQRVQKEVYGRQSHPRNDRNLSLLNFVVDKHFAAAEKNESPTWAELMKAWNHKNRSKAGWQYSDYRHLRRDFLATYRDVAFLGHSKRSKRR